MHLLIPYAAALAEDGRAAAPRRPRLDALIESGIEIERDLGDAWALSTPHERALARALGIEGGNGCLPWAARQARLDGMPPDDLAWGLLTPAHWHAGALQVSMTDPEALDLDAADSRTLFEAVQPLFTSEGYVCAWGAPLRWYVAHESLAQLATASPERAIGRDVDAWLGSDPAARRLRRLQSEVQMLLHTHPINAAREARGRPTVNSFWISGCGVGQPDRGPVPSVDARLRAPALAGDWGAWSEAWEALDAGPLAELQAQWHAGAASRLTLCGERGWVAYAPGPSGSLQRLRRLWSRPVPPWELL
ncbi:MAG: hypothetical protein KGJ30_17965 [Burkholderiales bacterium]|nr:hypothetical protein [Burkholderiales bacterium]MDE1926939.1 hypothetical protein [Burkholderiales bacterium]MDE2160803.1 hypothetical protein [Burkholderiales bacterium]